MNNPSWNMTFSTSSRWQASRSSGAVRLKKMSSLSYPTIGCRVSSQRKIRSVSLAYLTFRVDSFARSNACPPGHHFERH